MSQPSFDTFDFDKDERWSPFFGKFEIPNSTHADQAVVNKIKKKFYKQFIDPDFEIQSASSSTSSSSQQESSPEEQSDWTPPPPPTPSRPTSHSSSTSNPSNSSNSSASSSASNNSYLSPSAMQSVWIFLNSAIFFLGLVYLVLSFFAPWSSRLIYRAYLFCAFSNYTLSLYHSGALRNLNRQSLPGLIQTENGQQALICLIFLLYSPVTLFILPIYVFSFLHLSAFIQPLARQRYPVQAVQLEAMLTPENRLKGLFLAASFEFGVIIVLILNMFTGTGSIVLVISYWYFLSLRYKSSHYSKMTMDQFGERADGLFYHPNSPSIVRSIYANVRQFLRRFL